MSAKRIFCWLYGHDFGRWARDKKMGCYQRVCERCNHHEVDMARTPYARKRAANVADTKPGV